MAPPAEPLPPSGSSAAPTTPPAKPQLQMSNVDLVDLIRHIDIDYLDAGVSGDAAAYVAKLFESATDAEDEVSMPLWILVANNDPAVLHRYLNDLLPKLDGEWGSVGSTLLGERYPKALNVATKLTSAERLRWLITAHATSQQFRQRLFHGLMEAAQKSGVEMSGLAQVAQEIQAQAHLAEARVVVPPQAQPQAQRVLVPQVEGPWDAGDGESLLW